MSWSDDKEHPSLGVDVIGWNSLKRKKVMAFKRNKWYKNTNLFKMENCKRNAQRDYWLNYKTLGNTWDIVLENGESSWQCIAYSFREMEGKGHTNPMPTTIKDGGIHWLPTILKKNTHTHTHIYIYIYICIY